MTSMPAASSRALVSTLRSYATATLRLDGQGVVAVVPLLALGGHRVEAGVDQPQPVDAHGRAAAASRNGCGRLDRPARRRRRVGPVSAASRCGDVGVHHHRVDVDHGADGVQVHGGPVLVDRHGQHGVRQAQRRTPSGPVARHRPGVVRSPTPTASTPSARAQHVAALEVLLLPAVDPFHAGEAGVEAVDQLGQLGLAAAGPAWPAR